jgi:hypothetical protein
VIPKSQHAITQSAKHVVPDTILLRVGMLTSVGFDNEHLFTTNKVADIGSYGSLPNELVAPELTVSQTGP